MDADAILDSPHRRHDPLRDEWVLVSPHRAKRPWQGKVEATPVAAPSYDATCFLCPGNTRTNGETNPQYEGTFVFPNDFPALLTDGPTFETDDPLFRVKSAHGACKVLCYSPRHDQTLATMSVDEVERVVDMWVSTAADLGQTFSWVQIFENRGEIMGMSSPHPHGQVWAVDDVPTIVATEDSTQSAFYQRHGTPMLIETVRRESETGERVVAQNERWMWLVPFWAVWPFEILLIPRRPLRRFDDLEPEDRRLLAEILSVGLRKFDGLFEVPFPYSMGWHFAPFTEGPRDHWTLHAHFYPPLLRSATVRKHMVGFEMLAEAQRDITPETAAERLRQVPT